MDCRRFRKDHTAFLDDVLPGIGMEAMRSHLEVCEACARHDVLVRRSLLVFRNLPAIRPSADFDARLRARLQSVRPLGETLPAPRGMGLASYLAAAAALITVGFMSAVVVERGKPGVPPLMAPVVASQPEPARPAIATPVLMASVSTGMPMWPAMLMFDQTPVQFANTEFQLASWGR